jgi:Na+/proline symporter
MLEFLYQPIPDISYDFVVGVYLFASIIGLILFGLERAFSLDQLKGFWIIFFPFIPCLLWALAMRQIVKSNQSKQKSKQE